MTILDNGLRVLSSSMPHTRSVSICIFVGTGSRYEVDAEAGLFHFIEHVLFKGTHQRPSSTELSRTIEQVGGMMNGSTDRELTSYWCKVARPHFYTALDLLVDMVRNSLFDTQEVERERSVLQEELNVTNDQPGSRVEMLADQMLWPNQPMGRDIGGTRESLLGITRQMLLDRFQEHYGASNVVISVAGDVAHGQFLEAVAPLVKEWPQGKPPAWQPASHTDQTTPNVRMEYRKTEQGHLYFALPGVPNRHRDRYALDMMTTILGDGMSSRLFVEVREKRGLAYDIHASANHYHDTGSLAVYCGSDPKKAPYIVETVLGEFQSIKSDVSQEELHRAKELAKGRLLLRLEDTRAVAGWIGSQELLYNRVFTVDEVVEKVDAVTIADVERVASQFLATEKLNLAVVGPYRSDRQFHRALKL